MCELPKRREAPRIPPTGEDAIAMLGKYHGRSAFQAVGPARYECRLALILRRVRPHGPPPWLLERTDRAGLCESGHRHYSDYSIDSKIVSPKNKTSFTGGRL